jgi:hypothetical protein
VSCLYRGCDQLHALQFVFHAVSRHGIHNDHCLKNAVRKAICIAVTREKSEMELNETKSNQNLLRTATSAAFQGCCARTPCALCTNAPCQGHFCCQLHRAISTPCKDHSVRFRMGPLSMRHPWRGRMRMRSQEQVIHINKCACFWLLEPTVEDVARFRNACGTAEASGMA